MGLIDTLSHVVAELVRQPVEAIQYAIQTVAHFVHHPAETITNIAHGLFGHPQTQLSGQRRRQSDSDHESQHQENNDTPNPRKDRQRANPAVSSAARNNFEHPESRQINVEPRRISAPADSFTDTPVYRSRLDLPFDLLNTLLNNVNPLTHNLVMMMRHEPDMLESFARIYPTPKDTLWHLFALGGRNNQWDEEAASVLTHFLKWRAETASEREPTAPRITIGATMQALSSAPNHATVFDSDIPGPGRQNETGVPGNHVLPWLKQLVETIGKGLLAYGEVAMLHIVYGIGLTTSEGGNWSAWIKDPRGVQRIAEAYASVTAITSRIAQNLPGGSWKDAAALFKQAFGGTNLQLTSGWNENDPTAYASTRPDGHTIYLFLNPITDTESKAESLYLRDQPFDSALQDNVNITHEFGHVLAFRNSAIFNEWDHIRNFVKLGGQTLNTPYSWDRETFAKFANTSTLADISPQFSSVNLENERIADMFQAFVYGDQPLLNSPEPTVRRAAWAYYTFITGEHPPADVHIDTTGKNDLQGSGFMQFIEAGAKQ